MEPAHYKILLVDDDSFLLDIYSRKFTKAGHTIVVSTNADDALTKLREGLKPDIILSDMVMPGLDGIQMMEKIKSENLAQGSKLVMFTNQGQSSDIERANKLNLDGYLIKATTIPSEAVEQAVKIIENKK